MKKYRLHLRYIYTFYSFDEVLMEDVFNEYQPVPDSPERFTLQHQEEGSFLISELKEDFIGKYVVLTLPNKENLIIHENEDCELEYDEFSDGLGENNHNVYEGSLILEAEE